MRVEGKAAVRIFTKSVALNRAAQGYPVRVNWLHLPLKLVGSRGDTACRNTRPPSGRKGSTTSSAYMTEDFGGGPKRLKMAWVINFHKIFTLFIIAGMMA